MPRKKEEPLEAFDYEESSRLLTQSMGALHIMRIDEMPRIELYRDQVLSIVSTELAPLYAEDERIVTASMVNNYVKQGLLPAPIHKRYTRRHLAYLLFICIVRRALPIAEVAQLVTLSQQAQLDLPKTYDCMTDLLERTLAARFSEEATPRASEPQPLVLTDQNGNLVTGTLPQLLHVSVELVASKLYLEKRLALEALRQRQAEARE